MIYIQTGSKTGLMRAIQMLRVGESFLYYPKQGVKDATQIQCSVAKINKKRMSKGLDGLKVTQTKLLHINPKTDEFSIIYEVERVK